MLSFADIIKNKALEMGFTAAGITEPEFLVKADKDLQKYLQEGRHGTMTWLDDTAASRPDPKSFFPSAESVLIVALNYYRKNEKMLISPRLGNISIYARGRDYHKVLRNMLKHLLAWISQEESKTRGRIFVDSFPIMEKPLAARAGLGWIAKNSTLIIPGKGSFFFLGGILLNLPLAVDKPYKGDSCGSCSRCLQACPTGALTAPFRLDARKCISYLTIEHSGEIDSALHPNMGNYIFGCDICQLVCPWNIKFARPTTVQDFRSRFGDGRLRLQLLSELTHEQYEKMFEGSPVRRSGYHRFLRNVKIAAKNSGFSDAK
jgi:epoxyqueuosine reductase